MITAAQQEVIDLIHDIVFNGATITGALEAEHDLPGYSYEEDEENDLIHLYQNGERFHTFTEYTIE